MTIRPDISFWGETVNFDKMATMTDGVIIRAGQGGWLDPYAVEHLVESKGKLKRGVYWFYDDRYKPAHQAELLAGLLEWESIELGIWLDYERDYGGAYGSWRNFHTFLTEVKRLLPQYEVGIYTGYYYWLDKVPEEGWQYFKDCPLWLAWYTDNEADVWIPQPWTEMTMWQFTESGDGFAYGLDPLVKKAIDLNEVFGEDAPPVIEPPVEEPVTGTVMGKLLYGMAIRTSASNEVDNKVGGMWLGGVLEGELVGDMMRITTPLFMTVKKDGVTYIETDTSPAPEPPAPPPAQDAEIARFVVAPSEGYWYIEGDYPYRQVTFEGADARKPMPQTHVLYKSNQYPLWTPLPEKWQWFIHDLLKVANPGQSDAYYLAAYEDLVADHRAFTDLHDKDGHTDYVLRRNLELNSPYLWKTSITCKMNMIRDNYGLDITQDPPKPEDVFEDKALIHWSNQVYPEYLNNGMPKVVHFPQIKKDIDGKFEKTGTPIPYFKPPLQISHAGLISMIPGVEYPVVNLERDQT